MQIFVKKNGTATVQLNRDAMFYVNLIARNGKIAIKGTELGDFLSQGFGWYRIVSDRMNVVLQLIRGCIRKYRQRRDAETRALLAARNGAQVVSACFGDEPFVQYTLAPTVVQKPKVIRKVAESSVRIALNGMRATSAQLGALVGKFGRNK